MSRLYALCDGCPSPLHCGQHGARCGFGAFAPKPPAENLATGLQSSRCPTPGIGDVKSIPMVLHCPACGFQHIDAPEGFNPDHHSPDTPLWANPPHKSHLCAECGHQWRPADVPTTGVQAVATTGLMDGPVLQPFRLTAQCVRGREIRLFDVSAHLVGYVP